MEPWQFEPAKDAGLPMGERLRSTKREPGLIERLGGQAYASVVSTQLRWLQKLTVEGEVNLPQQLPFVLVANHCSHLDALVLATVLPGHLRSAVFPVAAGDTFFKTPLKAALSAGFINALPMWRKSGGRHGVDELRGRLTSEPCGLILFPEGTRSRDGQMGSFKPGLGMLIAGTPVPVVPCHLSGTFDAWPATAKWPKLGQPICARIGTPLRFEDAGHDRQGWTRVATETERAVAGNCARRESSAVR